MALYKFIIIIIIIIYFSDLLKETFGLVDVDTIAAIKISQISLVPKITAS